MFRLSTLDTTLMCHISAGKCQWPAYVRHEQWTHFKCLFLIAKRIAFQDFYEILVKLLWVINTLDYVSNDNTGNNTWIKLSTFTGYQWIHFQWKGKSLAHNMTCLQILFPWLLFNSSSIPTLTLQYPKDETIHLIFSFGIHWSIYPSFVLPPLLLSKSRNLSLIPRPDNLKLLKQIKTHHPTSN